MAALRGGAVSYERGTPVGLEVWGLGPRFGTRDSVRPDQVLSHPKLRLDFGIKLSLSSRAPTTQRATKGW